MLASKMLDLRIWQEIAKFTFKIALWEASWEVLCRIWKEIVDFNFKIALWLSSWEPLARIWQEIADFTFEIALWQSSWELLARIWQKLSISRLKLLSGNPPGSSWLGSGRKLPISL